MSIWADAIERDLEWRRVELAALKLKLFEEKPDPPDQPQSAAFKVLLRAAWGMLYAHYEGFCLAAFTRYLDQLEQMKVLRGQCKEPLILASLQHYFPKVRNKEQSDFFAFLKRGYGLMLDDAVDFPRDKKIKDEFELQGRSNLWPKLLHECCEKYCVYCGGIDPIDTRLRLLVGRRNAIAHGKDTPVRDFAEYEEYEQHVLDLMEKLGEAVNESLTKCNYLAADAKREHTEKLAYKVWQENGGDPFQNWIEAEERLANGERA